MKTTDSFSNKYTPRGEPVNYVEPPIINVDMFTDLVHQHTHAHRHNCSSISVLTGAAIICGLICSDLTSVCADAALFLCMYPSEHETPQWVHWHERLHRPLWGKKALLSFAIPVIHIPTNHCFKLCKVSHCNFEKQCPEVSMPFYRYPVDMFGLRCKMYHIQPKRLLWQPEVHTTSTHKTTKIMSLNCTICILIKLWRGTSYTEIPNQQNSMLALVVRRLEKDREKHREA